MGAFGGVSIMEFYINDKVNLLGEHTFKNPCTIIGKQEEYGEIWYAIVDDDGTELDGILSDDITKV